MSCQGCVGAVKRVLGKLDGNQICWIENAFIFCLAAF